MRIATPACGLVRNDRARGAAGNGCPLSRAVPDSSPCAGEPFRAGRGVHAYKGCGARRAAGHMNPAEMIGAEAISVLPHERAAETGAEGIRKQGFICNARLRKRKFFDNYAPICAKDSKTLVFAAFFGYFLSLEKESTPPEAKNGLPHQ